MRWKPALGALLFIAAIPVALSEGLGPAWSVALVVIGIGAGWLLVPGFWRKSLYGAIGGAISGLLVLGPGFRIAMRIVAIVDPVRSPEFTVGGTMFILIGVGLMMGGVFGVIASIARGGFNISSRGASAVPAVLVMLLIGLDTELRFEILELGVGPWLNVPMFAAAAIGYGILWTRVVAWLESRRLQKQVPQVETESAKMALSDPRGLEA